jgi:hypothetical protein
VAAATAGINLGTPATTHAGARTDALPVDPLLPDALLRTLLRVLVGVAAVLVPIGAVHVRSVLWADGTARRGPPQLV